MNNNKSFGWILIIIGFCAAALFAYMTAITSGFPKIFIIPIASLPALIFGGVGIWMVKGDKKAADDRVKRQSAPRTVNTKFKEIHTMHDSDLKHYYYYVITSWVNPDDNKLYLFKSDEIGYDATEFIETNGITEFPVTFEDGNIKNYEVDINKLKRGDL